jgi:hypothetical protein
MVFTLSILTYHVSIDLNRIIDEQNVRMNKIEKTVFRKSFHRVFKPFQFKKVFELAGYKKTMLNKNFIIGGDSLRSIYYFPKIPKYERVVLKDKDTVLSYLNDGSWIGKSNLYFVF